MHGSCWRNNGVIEIVQLIAEIWLYIKFKQVTSFRESRSDGRRFYIFTATKTLHLKTNTKRERGLWLEALASSRSLFSLLRPLHDNPPLSPDNIPFSTERLKRRLAEDGVNESLVKDCEEIMLSEFSELQGKLKVLYEERSNLLDTLRRLEVISTIDIVSTLFWFVFIAAPGIYIRQTD